MNVVLVGRDNSIAAFGRDWRTVRELAARLKVPALRVRRLVFFRADLLLAAIEREASAAPDAPVEIADEDELAALRTRLGKKRKSA